MIPMLIPVTPTTAVQKLARPSFSKRTPQFGYRKRSGLLLIALFTGFAPLAPQAADGLPEANAVTRRMIARAQAVAQSQTGPHYVYDKRSLFEQLNPRGEVLRTEEKLYRVTLVGGYPFNRLVKVQGRDLSPEQLAEQQEREDRFRQKFSSMDAREKVERREAWVTEQLLERYDFVVQERTMLADRPVLVLAFKPKAGKLPTQSVQDKFLNRLAGTVWVDEAEADTVRLKVRLIEPFSLGWLGFLGSLNRCEFSLDRRRMPDGVWVNDKQVLTIHCRKLASTLYFRSTEQASGFQRSR